MIFKTKLQLKEGRWYLIRYEQAYNEEKTREIGPVTAIPKDRYGHTWKTTSGYWLTDEGVGYIAEKMMVFRAIKEVPPL